MKISVVIPTYKRVKDLEECLDSILIQTVLPIEVIVVDNGKSIETENLVMEKSKKFKDAGINLRYIKNEKENSLTVARNLGIKNSDGDFISFLDDDVVLSLNYYKELTSVFKMYSDALGVCGLAEFEKKKGSSYKKITKPLFHLFLKLFFLGFNEKDKFRLLPSLGVTSPSLEYGHGSIVTNCEWISGASIFRKEIFNEFEYDENLKKYSWGEDTDFSHRVFKKYPGSLFCNPNARYLHKLSKSGRIPKKELLFMEEVYYLYVFYKIIDQKLKNKLIYLWSRIGRMLFKMLYLVMKPSKSTLFEVKYSIEACFYCIKHLKEIKKGDLDFFNRTIIKSD